MAKILILDDDLEGKPDLEECLGNKHELSFAATSAEMFETLKSATFALVLISVCLQNENVLGILQKAKMSFLLHKIPFVCFRAPDAPDLEAMDDTMGIAMMTLGARGYIGATDWSELLTKVDQSLADSSGQNRPQKSKPAKNIGKRIKSR